MKGKESKVPIQHFAGLNRSKMSRARAGEGALQI